MPAVVVDFAEPPPAMMAEALVAACTKAVGRGACVVGDSTQGAPDVQATAVVVWEGAERDSVRIWITLDPRPGATVLERSLQFAPTDEPLERWRATGFVLGTIVSEAEHDREAPTVPSPSGPGVDAAPRAMPVRADPNAEVPPAAPASSERAPVAPRPARAATASREAAPPPEQSPPHRPIWTSLGALAGPGLDRGMWRFGGVLRAGYAFEAVPLMLCGAVSYAVRPVDDQGLGVDWVGLGVGGGVHGAVDVARLGVATRLELLVERVGIWATDPATGVEESGSHWKAGPRIGVEAWWPDREVAAVLLGADGWLLSGETAIVLRGADAATAPFAGFSLAAGLRVALP